MAFIEVEHKAIATFAKKLGKVRFLWIISLAQQPNAHTH